jgi:hypothetical protein
MQFFSSSNGAKSMSDNKAQPTARDHDRIDIHHEYELCAWAKHFNASEKRIKEAVAAVGDRVGKVREHLSADRPSSN